MSRRSTIGILLSLLLVSLIVVVWLISRAGSGSPSTPVGREIPDGPILNRPEHGYIVAGARRGMIYTDGLETLQVQGEQPIIIDDVLLSESEQSVTLLGSLLAGPNRRDGIISRLNGFPPTSKSLGKIVPAQGATLQPSNTLAGTKDYELLVGLRISSSHVALRQGIWVNYHIGDKKYADYLNAKAIYCPAGRTEHACAKEVGVPF